MAWGTKILDRSPSAHFLQLWADRIEKEEKAFVRGIDSSLEVRASPQGHRRRDKGSDGSGRERSHRHGRLGRSASAAPGSSLTESPGPPSPLGSALSGPRSRSGGSVPASRTTRSSETPSHLRDPELPHDLRPMCHFPLTDHPLMKMRTREASGGRIPRLRYRPVEVDAHWIPGSKRYTAFQPEFYLEDPK
mmetsp:Transcript_49714/g.142261  ORF Transcript_49714/g.142261 Transcript_49714/m.142261 type:complete len:191 (-) Transcript_49714:457-1029(-)